MKTPSSSKEITKVWLEHALGEHVAKTRPRASLSVLSFTVAKGTNPGDGFNSELAMVDVETSVREAASSVTTDEKIVYHLMAKFLSSDPMSREFNHKVKADMKEYLMYSEVIREMNEFQAARAPEEPQIPIPDLIYGKCTEKTFILLMENIKYLGYETNDKYKGLDYHHAKGAVDMIARVHALSYAYGQSSNFPEKYPFIQSVVEYIRTFKMMAHVTHETCSAFLKSLGDKEDVLRRLELSKKALIDGSVSSLPVGGDTMACLNHGDFWNNNFMYRYKDPTPGQTQREIEGIKIIDWACCTWGSPMHDLQYLLHTSTTGAVRKAHLEELLQQYHSTFANLTAKLGYPATKWDFDQFMSDWKQTLVVGFMLGATLTMGTLSTCNPVNKEVKPSVLDKPICFPIRMAVDGLKVGMAKLISGLMLTQRGESIMRSLLTQVLKPVREEIVSGKNKDLNTRLLDLIIEADENGLFNGESE
ncbi:uncharacterized protein [Panulirus ornatus]|uniref:uncharacterized protein n=1 Tax=Panulirus ornatus TaxID=150431 RepID=UPI003A8C6875